MAKQKNENTISDNFYHILIYTYYVILKPKIQLNIYSYDYWCSKGD